MRKASWRLRWRRNTPVTGATGNRSVVGRRTSRTRSSTKKPNRMSSSYHQTMAEQLGTLLVSCPDQKGIVATLAQVLFSQGANIVDADQHTDPIAGMFFQRICFDLST